MFDFKSNGAKEYDSVLHLFLYGNRDVQLRAQIPSPEDVQIPWVEFTDWFSGAPQDWGTYTLKAGNLVECFKFSALSHYEIRVEEVK